MGKIFISYCEKNKELIEIFMEFLQLGMGVEKEDIFCTSCRENIKSGTIFMERIRRELGDCGAVVSLITEEYLNSKFCLMEAGAAWAMSKHFFPLLLVPFSALNDTPLCGLQMRRLDWADDLGTFYDELFECQVAGKRQTAAFNKRLPVFLDKVSMLTAGEREIQKDKDGFYQVVIREVRKVRDNYRCYGIRGRIADPPDREKADSDWIFFWRDMYPDLQVGDRVKFKCEKSEVRTFSDLGRARNLYPSELFRLD